MLAHTNTTDICQPTTSTCFSPRGSMHITAASVLGPQITPSCGLRPCEAADEQSNRIARLALRPVQHEWDPTHRPVAAAGYRPSTLGIRDECREDGRLTGDPAGESRRPLPSRPIPRSAGADASRLSWCSTESPSRASSASRDLHSSTSPHESSRASPQAFKRSSLVDCGWERQRRRIGGHAQASPPLGWSVMHIIQRGKNTRVTLTSGSGHVLLLAVVTITRIGCRAQ